MPLFEVAVLLKPTKKEAEEGGSEKLVLGPTPVVAGDAQSAAIAAVMGDKELATKSLDMTRLAVLVRPFA